MTTDQSDVASARNTFAYVDFLRGGAALWVLVTHCGIWGGWTGPTLPDPKHAVDLFMMISGLLMAATIRTASPSDDGGPVRRWLAFMTRRWFRIAPVYYVVLAIVFVAGSGIFDGYSDLRSLYPERWIGDIVYDPHRLVLDLANAAWHVTFLFGLHPERSFSTMLPDWSLSLEMQFYVTFPLLAAAMRRWGHVTVAIVVTAGSIAAWSAVERAVSFREPSLLVAKLPYFLVGMLAHHILTTVGWRRRVVPTLVAVAIASFEVQYGRLLVLGPAMLGVMLVLGDLERTGMTPSVVRRVVSSPVVGLASRYSYGVYLTHGFFISLWGVIVARFDAMRDMSSGLQIVMMVVFVATGAYLTAGLLYRLLEVPGIAVGRRIAARVDPRR